MGSYVINEGELILKTDDEKPTIIHNLTGENSANEEFIQTDITPMDLENASIINFSNGKNGQALLTIYDNINNEPKAFLYKNGDWVEQNNEGATKFLNNNSYSDAKIICDYSNNWWIFIKEENIFNKAFKVSQDGSFLELIIPEFMSANQILVSEQGLLYLNTTTNDNGKILFIDTNTGEKTMKYFKKILSSVLILTMQLSSSIIASASESTEATTNAETNITIEAMNTKSDDEWEVSIYGSAVRFRGQPNYSPNNIIRLFNHGVKLTHIGHVHESGFCNVRYYNTPSFVYNQYIWH